MNSGRRLLRARGLDINLDVPPLLLAESGDAEDTPGEVADEDGRPDVGRAEPARRLQDGADAERDNDLRDDRDIERTARVTRALQAAGVAEGDGDEQS